jgi:hypothetical protein
MRRSLAVSLAALLALGCTFDEQVIGVAPTQVVVHAVLDRNASIQEVLVERTLTGGVAIRDGVRYDPLDPINSGEGVPVSGAEVTVTGPGVNVRGFERAFTDKPPGYGAGRYEVPLGVANSGTQLRAGQRYTLTVKTKEGTVVTGTTQIPNAPFMVPQTSAVTFDRDRDSVRLSWNAVPGARTYGLRVESPFGPFLLFSDTTNLALPGDGRNFYASDLQRLFIPGFQQAITVFAVDTNFFDYYRSRNDPFTGSGIINKLQGGIGLFGSISLVASRIVDVTQQPKEPAIEGDYELAQAPAVPQRYVDVFRLYVETSGPPTSLSGWYSRDRRTLARDGIAGARDGARIELEFLLDQDARRRLVTFVGAQEGDSLVGAYNGISGRVVYRRRR